MRLYSSILLNVYCGRNCFYTYYELQFLFNQIYSCNFILTSSCFKIVKFGICNCIMIYSSVLAQRIPGTGELVDCRLWGCTESYTTEAAASHNGIMKRYSIMKLIMGCRLWGCTESDTTEAAASHNSIMKRYSIMKLINKTLGLCMPSVNSAN